MLWGNCIHHFVIVAVIGFADCYDFFNADIILNRNSRVVFIGDFWNRNYNCKWAIILPLKKKICDLYRFNGIYPVSGMDKLILKNESVIQYVFDNTEFSRIMKEEEAITEVIQN